MRSLLTPRLALLTAAHFTVDAYSSFFSPLLPLLAARLDLSLARVGTLVALASMASSLSQPLFGLAADRVRRPWLIALGPMVAALFMSLVGRATGFGMLAGLLVASGFGISWFHPQSAVLATRSAARRSLAMSVFITGGTLGGALGPMLSVGAVARFGLEGSWVAMFPGLALALALMVALARVHGTGPVAGAPAPALRELRPVLRPIALLYLTVVTRSAIASGFMTFLPMHLHRLGYPVAFGGTALTVFMAAGALGGFAGGWMAERIGGRRVLVQSFLGALPLFALFLVLPTVPGLACLALGSFVLQGSLPVSVVLGQELAPRHSSTVSSLMMGAAWGVGALVVAPVGALADAFGLRAALATLAALIVVGLACSLVLPEPRERPTVEALA